MRLIHGQIAGDTGEITLGEHQLRRAVEPDEAHTAIARDPEARPVGDEPAEPAEGAGQRGSDGPLAPGSRQRSWSRPNPTRVSAIAARAITGCCNAALVMPAGRRRSA